MSMLLIMWDFDGTLVNSEIFFKQIIHDFIVESGYIDKINNFTNDFYYLNMAGTNDYDMFETMLKHNIIKNISNIDKIVDDEFLPYSEKRFKEIKIGEIKIIEKMDNLLEYFYKKNLMMLIATSAHYDDFIKKCYSVNNKIINELDKYSSHKIPDNYKYLNLEKYIKKTKSNPAVFLYAFEKSFEKNNNITDILIIEDSNSGVQAGKNFKGSGFIKNKNINVKVIGFSAGSHNPNEEKLMDSGADIVINSVDKLLKTIDLYLN